MRGSEFYPSFLIKVGLNMNKHGRYNYIPPDCEVKGEFLVNIKTGLIHNTDIPYASVDKPAEQIPDGTVITPNQETATPDVIEVPKQTATKATRKIKRG